MRDDRGNTENYPMQYNNQFQGGSQKKGFRLFYIFPILYVLSIYAATLPLIVSNDGSFPGIPLYVPFLFAVVNPIVSIIYCRPGNRDMLFDAVIFMKFTLIPLYTIGGIILWGKGLMMSILFIPIPMATTMGPIIIIIGVIISWLFLAFQVPYTIAYLRLTSKDKIRPAKQGVIHALLQFIFVIDVIDVVVLIFLEKQRWKRTIVTILLTVVAVAGIVVYIVLQIAIPPVQEDVNLKIVKSGVKIEDVGFDPDLGYRGVEVYKFTVPIEITGTFEHDCTIPVYYNFDTEMDELGIQSTVSHGGDDIGPSVTCEGKLKIKKGTTGIVYFEGETDAEIHSTDSAAHEYAWVVLGYDDGFVPDNYAVICNPFYDKEQYWHLGGRESFFKEVRDIEPQETEGNVYIDEDSIVIEKTYIGEEPGKPQHYTVSADIKNDADNPVSVKNLWVACDYDLRNANYAHDCDEALSESISFMRGVSFGYTVQQKSITEKDDSIHVEFDVYNRYAGFKDNLTGNDLDWFHCFWIAICLDDENRNDNYVIFPNPYFNEEHYTDKELWLEHSVNEIYRYTMHGWEWDKLVEEKEGKN